MAWDSNLDPQSPAYQIAADNSRYIRVLAGPGTGKSFALKRRVARILEDGIAPTRILPVTFTKVAAEDLQRELINMGVPGCEQIRGSTLHSFGMRVLSLQNVLAVTGRVSRPLNRFEMEPLLYDLPTGFGKKRERQRRIRAYEAAWARLQHEEPGFAQAAADAAFQNVLVAWLRFHEGMLIGEIIPELYRYLRNNPAAPERSLYDHVLVDEYQDLNRAEQAVVDLLTTSAALCVVGDDDQSLYSFKHAHPEGIRTFPRTHPGCTDHALLDCYRCPTGVVAIANALIGHNVDRGTASVGARSGERARRDVDRAISGCGPRGAGDRRLRGRPDQQTRTASRGGSRPGPAAHYRQSDPCRVEGPWHSVEIPLSGDRTRQGGGAGAACDIQALRKPVGSDCASLASWYW